MRRQGYEELKQLSLSVDRNDRVQCTAANGQTIDSLGSVLVPIQADEQIRLIKVVVTLGVPHLLIVDVDFWRRWIWSRM